MELLYGQLGKSRVYLMMVAQKQLQIWSIRRHERFFRVLRWWLIARVGWKTSAFFLRAENTTPPRPSPWQGEGDTEGSVFAALRKTRFTEILTIWDNEFAPSKSAKNLFEANVCGVALRAGAELFFATIQANSWSARFFSQPW